MKTVRAILLLLALVIPARAQYNFLQITNHTILVEGGDSFEWAQYGNRDIGLEAFLILMNPNWDVEPRIAARSGGSNLETLQSRGPMYFFPHFFASHAKTNVLLLEYVSSNGGQSSNQIYGQIKEELLYPKTVRDQAGNITNDWTQSTNLYKKAIIGDIAYNAAGGDPTTLARNLGASNACSEAGVPFVNTWLRLVNVVTNQRAIDPTRYWFNAPNYDHPANELHLLWTLVKLQDLGAETNVWTAILDYTTTTASSTNHCTVSSITKPAGAIQFTLHRDRAAFGWDVPDGTVTNDCRGAFDLMPSMTNAFYEVLQITNLPAGNCTVAMNGVNVAVVSSAELATGWNTWRLYAGPFWIQKKAINRDLRLIRNISPADASTRNDTSGNILIENYESYASARWPTNTFGVDYYCGLMQDREAELTAFGVSNMHADAQQSDVTILITPWVTLAAPFK